MCPSSDLCYNRAEGKNKVSPLASPRYPFKEAVIQAAPEDAGVYALLFGDKLLYVGLARRADKADTLRGRLLAHVWGEMKPAIATHYSWEITSDPEGRLAELLEALGPNLPPYNEPRVGG